MVWVLISRGHSRCDELHRRGLSHVMSTPVCLTSMSILKTGRSDRNRAMMSHEPGVSLQDVLGRRRPLARSAVDMAQRTVSAGPSYRMVLCRNVLSFTTRLAPANRPLLRSRRPGQMSEPTMTADVILRTPKVTRPPTVSRFDHQGSAKTPPAVTAASARTR